jgi:hypothetical protein
MADLTGQNSNYKLFTSLKINIQDILSETLQFLQDRFKQTRAVFTAASPYGQLLIVFENLSQLIFYYIEDSITELNLNEASRASSIYSLASLAGHNPSRAIGATAQIRVLRKPNITEPPASKVVLNDLFRVRCTQNGLVYVMELPQDEIRLSLVGEATNSVFSLRQGVIESQTFTAKGKEFDSFQLGYPNNFYIDNFIVNVYVNGERWQKYESLLDIPRNGKGFLCKTGITNGVDLYFGNGSFGKIPTAGSEIVVEYLATDGSAGNIKVDDPAQIQFTFEDTGFAPTGEEINLNDYFDIFTVSPPNFGVDPENLELTRLIAPKASKNFALVNVDNYEVLLRKMQMFSTIKVYLPQDSNGTILDSRMINLFLVPDVSKLFKSGEDYFNLPTSKFKLSAFQKNELIKYIERSGTKMISTDVQIVDPTITRYVLFVSIIAFDDVAPEIIKSDITDAVGKYFIALTRHDRVPKSDLIKIIEEINGVDSVNVSIIGEKNEIALKANPNAAPIGLDEFNDIVIRLDEFPVIRGGWTDSKGNEYADGISEEKLGAINIQIKKRVNRKSMNSFASAFATPIKEVAVAVQTNNAN